jgi:hypothetical protein
MSTSADKFTVKIVVGVVEVTGVCWDASSNGTLPLQTFFVSIFLRKPDDSSVPEDGNFSLLSLVL